MAEAPGGCLATAALALLLALGHPTVASPEVFGSIGRGDEAWSQRNVGGVAGRAAAGPIGGAVAAYEEALAEDGRSLEARWKLLRALYFQGEYATEGRPEKLEIYLRSRAVAEAGLDQLAETLGGRKRLDELTPAEIGEAFAGDQEAAEIFFWAAVHWGLWGRERGKIAAARRGVATKIRRFAEAAIAIDERVQNAGGHRLLGRLHHEAPRIPLVTGWVSQRTAIAELRRAVELAPEDLLSRLYLAEALLEQRQSRAEGFELLEALVNSKPSKPYRVEDERTLELARAALAEHSD